MADEIRVIDGRKVRIYWFGGSAWATTGSFYADESGWTSGARYSRNRHPWHWPFGYSLRGLFRMRGTRTQREARAIRHLLNAVEREEAFAA